ncbi:hypothetical protein [uncultured Chitinophaga sp.]|uniref:hypothetical protein n=1 Tax=uncultured Chitinophaga sp. TaxID=339340 RepID=UPI0025DBA70E|nr:hypothetical protein [uncultured Chitinophaga sp.]
MENGKPIYEEIIARFQQLLKQVQPQVKELKRGDVHLFKARGRHMGLVNTYADYIQLVVFPPTRKFARNMVYDYRADEQINWHQIEMIVKANYQQA